jgi:tRNA(Ile)-lysidine synthase
LAVSGGPDSLAMLVLAHLASPGMVEAATVDHGLRPESAGEAAHVAAVCQALGVPHAILSVNVGPGNVQANARSARYAALGAWAQERGLQSIATAHHADDQAETVLMRLNRASGLGGLAGIRAKTAGDGGPPVIRPLLGWRKQELEAVVSAADLFFVRDPSNVDVRFDRARLRAGRRRPTGSIRLPLPAAPPCWRRPMPRSITWLPALAIPSSPGRTLR